MHKLALIGATVIGAVVLSASPISVKWSADRNLSVSQDKAAAEIGRPGTPGSVAGVARRANRRAVRRGGRDLPPLTRLSNRLHLSKQKGTGTMAGPPNRSH